MLVYAKALLRFRKNHFALTNVEIVFQKGFFVITNPSFGRKVNEANGSTRTSST